jgi:hypothetical protein
VRQELAGYSLAAERPGLREAAMRLAAGMDNPSFAASHAAMCRQLVSLLDQLAPKPRSARRLAAVVALADRRPAGKSGREGAGDASPI